MFPLLSKAGTSPLVNPLNIRYRRSGTREGALLSSQWVVVNCKSRTNSAAESLEVEMSVNHSARGASISSSDILDTTRDLLSTVAKLIGLP